MEPTTAAALAALIDRNPTACYRTLERKAYARGILRGTGDADVYARLIEARPLCNMDACDDTCHYSGRCEA